VIANPPRSAGEGLCASSLRSACLARAVPNAIAFLALRVRRSCEENQRARSISAIGVTKVPNRAVKRRLGFSDVQPFDSAMLDAVARVASTALGDDCGEGGAESDWARSMFAHRNDVSRSYLMLAGLRLH
jgi:hypothetical protein